MTTTCEERIQYLERQTAGRLKLLDDALATKRYLESECDKLHAALAAATGRAERDEAQVAVLREALGAAGTDLIGFSGYFERIGSAGTVASIERTLARIDAALAPAPSSTGEEVGHEPDDR